MSERRSVALAVLLQRLAGASVTGDASRARIGQIATDSRRVEKDALFVALRGEHVDGHAFIADVVRRGAAAVVVESESTVALAGDAVVVRVGDTRRALSSLAATFYGDPSRALEVIGVTGTNGKTTTTRMLAAIFEEAGRPCGVIGTIGAEFRGQTWQLAQTTPLPEELHALLAVMSERGARAVAMEVSSHALALERVEDVRFRCGVLTNVTRDHLDFHGTQEAYAAAKRRLFSMSESAVLNADDASGARWAQELQDALPLLTYALRAPADIVARDVALRADGSTFHAGDVEVRLALPGRFNVENALAAIGAARMLGIDDTTSARALQSVARVAGRMERVADAEIDVFVDYAHTPDALEQSLLAAREIARGELAVVFGCGGDRDRGKRAQMGEIAARLADRIYLTNDNPRTENPREIASEIERGIGSKAHVVELDRRSAIARAIAEARPRDFVLIAGKGHEAYQIIGTRTLSFDDVRVAREALERLR